MHSYKIHEDYIFGGGLRKGSRSRVAGRGFILNPLAVLGEIFIYLFIYSFDIPFICPEGMSNHFFIFLFFFFLNP